MSELQGLQSRLDDIEATGTVVVAVCRCSAEEGTRKMKELGLGFGLVADENLELIDKFDLRHEGASIDGGDIARPALFAVDRQGVIRLAFLTDNWRIRQRVGDLIRVLESVE